MTKKTVSPPSQDFQDILIRRSEPYSGEHWSVVLLTRHDSGARLAHVASSKREALQWALDHLTDSGGDGDNRSRDEALEVGHIPFPET